MEVDRDLLTTHSTVFERLLLLEMEDSPELDLTDFSEAVVRAVVVDSLPDQQAKVTRENFQEFNKICLAFRLTTLQGQCTQFYKRWCEEGLTDDPTVSLPEVRLLGDLAVYMIREAWGERAQLLGPLKERLQALPALRAALIDEYTSHRHNTDHWAWAEVVASVASPPEIVNLYTWLNTLLASRGEARLTMSERSLLREEYLATCMRESPGTSDKIMATLAAKGYPEIDLRFALLQVSKAAKFNHELAETAAAEAAAAHSGQVAILVNKCLELASTKKSKYKL